MVALASRNRLGAERAAAFIGPSVRAVSCSELPRLAARILIAVSDEGIGSVAQILTDGGMQSGVALHTCGAKGAGALAVLQAAGVACGVLHPLQTVVSPDQGVRSLEGVSFAVSGDGPALQWAEEIVARLRGRSLHINADRLSCYHAGAVLVSNALVAVVDAAVVLLKRAGVAEQDGLLGLEPLARTSLENIFSRGPKMALTGPIARGDVATVTAHLDALASAPPTIAALYRAAAQCLVDIGRARGLPEPTVREFQSAIETSKGGERQ